MGGFFSRPSAPPPPPAQPAPVVQPKAAVRAEDDTVRKKKRKVSGEKATILTGTQGLTATGESTSVKTLLGG